MPPKPTFKRGFRKLEVDKTEGAVRSRGKATDKQFFEAISTLEFHSKWVDLSMLWEHHMLEVLDRLQMLLQPTSPGLADTVRNIWIVFKEATSGLRKGPSTSQDLWIDVEEVMIEPSKGLTSTVNGMLDVFLGYEIHKDALVLSNILPNIDSLLSFPVTNVRTKSVMLVKKWRVIMDLHPLDEEAGEGVSQETVHIMSGHGDVPAADVCHRILLDKLVKIIEKARCMDLVSLKLGRKAIDMFPTSLMTKDALTATKVLVQMQDFGDHPDPYVHQRCDEIVARLRFFLTTQPPVNGRSLEVATPRLSEVATHSKNEYSEDAMVRHDIEKLDVRALQDLCEAQLLKVVDWAKMVPKRVEHIQELLCEVAMGQESNQEEESDTIKELRYSLKWSKSMIDSKGQMIDNQRETLQAQRRILDANESNLAGMRSEMESTVANMMLEMEKQRSKYYQDVEKGVNETTVALRQQRNAARTDASLYKQVSNEKEKLQQENIIIRQDKARLLTAKLQKETECKAAEDSIKVITEGYDQLKKTVTELEENVIELQVDNDYLLQERDDLRNAVESLKAEALLSQRAPMEDATVTSTTKRYARELQHLDSTIMVWEKDLAAAQAKRKTTQDKKNEVDAQIAELKAQIKALKHPKGKTPEQLLPPPVVPQMKLRSAPTPPTPLNHLALPSRQVPHQESDESPSPPGVPRVRLPAGPASLRPAPTQQ
ncbi:hypothetical protein HBH86_113860 [Parastagonospora nodorum]|nr:hypothetical protein HBH86_113860 [Parastagonospora nodorum]KAH5971185.1 hypothetical protein HBI86_043330 [Parastagonospora nodorum]